jgi:sugar phosphate isomerase/epimerase
VALHLSRRDVLQRLGLLPAAFASLPPCSYAGTTEPALEFPTKPRDRLALTSYPFRAYIESPSNRSNIPAGQRIDMTQFPALVIDKFGIRNINPLIAHFRSTDAAYFARFRKAVSDAGSHVVDLGLGGREFYSPDPATREAAIADGRKWIDMAVEVGSPSVRQHVQGSKGQRPDVQLAAASLGKMADYGAKRNVVVNLENDSPVAEDPFFLVAVIEKAGNPYLRGLPDFGNALQVHDAEFNKRGVAAMLKHAFNMCHVKGMVETDKHQQATVDLKTMFALAKENSYKGYFSMEFETLDNDPFEGTRKLVAETLKYLT